VVFRSNAPQDPEKKRRVMLRDLSELMNAVLSSGVISSSPGVVESMGCVIAGSSGSSLVDARYDEE